MVEPVVVEVVINHTHLQAVVDASRQSGSDKDLVPRIVAERRGFDVVLRRTQAELSRPVDAQQVTQWTTEIETLMEAKAARSAAVAQQVSGSEVRWSGKPLDTGEEFESTPIDRQDGQQQRDA